MQPAVWIVGDWQHADFFAPLAWLQQAARCTAFDHPAAACDTLRAGREREEPAAILFAESHPGQIPAAEAERLLSTYPLARTAVLFGPWCEGPQRKSRSLPGIVRVHWSCWQSRLARELGLSEEVEQPLPRTMTETERIERGRQGWESVHRQRGRVAICTSSRASFQALADATQRLGFAPIWQAANRQSQVLDCEAMIFDGWEQVLGEEDLRVEFDASGRPKRVVLVSFPRPADFFRAASLGIDAVIAQPMSLTDLATALERATGLRAA